MGGESNKKQILCLLRENASAYGLHIEESPGYECPDWTLTLAVSRDEPATTTIYTGHVRKFDAAPEATCGFIQLDDGGSVFVGRVAAPEGLRRGDRVELRVVPDVSATRRKGTKQYKAWDVNIIERGPEGRELDSLESAQDEPAETITGERVAGVIKNVNREQKFGVFNGDNSACGSIIPDDGSPAIYYSVRGWTGDELFEGLRVTYVLGSNRKGRVAHKIKLIKAAPVAPAADAPAGPLPTLLLLDDDFCLEFARELLRSPGL